MFSWLCVIGISAALLSVMGSRFKKSGKIFPAGVVSLLSLVMVGGYAHGIMRSSHAWDAVSVVTICTSGVRLVSSFLFSAFRSSCLAYLACFRTFGDWLTVVLHCRWTRSWCSSELSEVCMGGWWKSIILRRSCVNGDLIAEVSMTVLHLFFLCSTISSWSVKLATLANV